MTPWTHVKFDPTSHRRAAAATIYKEVAHGTITGFGLRSYVMGLDIAVELAASGKRAAT
jgi:3-dehydroquinate dehydratase